MKWKVFASYGRACGVCTTVTVIISYMVYTAIQVAANVWLSAWSSDRPINGTQDIPKRNLRLGVYGAFGGIQGEWEIE